jgi:hypothetical protein
VNPIHFNRENLTFALTNILAHKFRSLLTILGIQFITLGLLAEIMVRAYHEAAGKTTYFVREVLEAGPAKKNSPKA